MIRLRWRAIALCALGLAQMGAAILDLDLIRGAAFATAASPAPKVFCSAKGLETFTTKFKLAWRTPDGTERELSLDRSVYARLRGPYNRRNVWGAVLAFGPVLETDPRARPMLHAVARHGLCGEAPILRELGVDPTSVRELTIRYEPRAGSSPDLPMMIRPECDR